MKRLCKSLEAVCKQDDPLAESPDCARDLVFKEDNTIWSVDKEYKRHGRMVGRD